MQNQSISHSLSHTHINKQERHLTAIQERRKIWSKCTQIKFFHPFKNSYITLNKVIINPIYFTMIFIQLDFKLMT